MSSRIKTQAKPTKLSLAATTASEMMTPNPVVVRSFQTIQEAISILVDRGVTAVPVVDSTNHPIGVLSQTDIIRFEREKVSYVSPLPDYYERVDLALPSGEEAFYHGFQLQKIELSKISEIMTPIVFSVAPDTLAMEVIDQMLKRKIHRLFVVDSTGGLLGVISALDILRCVQAAG